jgi:hypothetical protein
MILMHHQKTKNRENVGGKKLLQAQELLILASLATLQKLKPAPQYQIIK